MTDRIMFKTTPYKHQADAFNFCKDRDHAALFMEQGTGKTKVALDIASYQYWSENIDMVLIFAPKGVHTNWINREIPKHLSIDAYTLCWQPNITKKFTKSFEEGMAHPGAFIFAVNIDAIITKKFQELLKRIVKERKVMVILDESSRIKNFKAKRTKRFIKLGEQVDKRLILTGTPVTQGPFDVFSQFKFLSPSIFHKSFVVFKSTYGIFETITLNAGRSFKSLVSYKNLPQLTEIIKQHAFIITKDECLDLPPKVYRTDSLFMTANQLATYHDVCTTLRSSLHEDMDITNVLTKLGKLQQVTSGFLMHEGEVAYFAGLNTKLNRLEEIIEEGSGKMIIWIRFRAEIPLIKKLLCKDSTVYYVGGTSKEDREAAVDRFQNDPDVRFFVGNPRAAGLGLTLTAARTVVYFSNSFSLEDRLQSEDRAHRIGQTGSVLYIDLVCKGTIDEKIKAALEGKQKIADLVTDKSYLKELLG